MPENYSSTYRIIHLVRIPQRNIQNRADHIQRRRHAPLKMLVRQSNTPDLAKDCHGLRQRVVIPPALRVAARLVEHDVGRAGGPREIGIPPEPLFFEGAADARCEENLGDISDVRVRVEVLARRDQGVHAVLVDASRTGGLRAGEFVHVYRNMRREGAQKPLVPPGHLTR